MTLGHKMKLGWQVLRGKLSSEALINSEISHLPLPSCFLIFQLSTRIAEYSPRTHDKAYIGRGDSVPVPAADSLGSCLYVNTTAGQEPSKYSSSLHLGQRDNRSLCNRQQRFWGHPSCKPSCLSLLQFARFQDIMGAKPLRRKHPHLRKLLEYSSI